MTITKRKQKVQPADDSGAAAAPLLESGTKASCDSCSADITHNVHVRCAETTAGGAFVCPDFDLCVPCFLAGKSIGNHRAHHAYRIISSHAFPIFDKDWGADEELLLIEGAELYGLGNWADTAEHVGGRSKEECHQHYLDIYINSPDYPLPVTGLDLGDQESFQARKKQRLEDMQSQPLALPPPKPLASAPTCHDVGGFMPGRLEFETEYENEAETLVKDMEFSKVAQFGGDSQPGPPPPPGEEGEEVKPEGGGEGDAGEESDGDLELKLTILEMFNERYDRRVAAKDLIFDRGLINYRQLTQAEKKKTKEEKDIIQRTKVFARIQTAQDHEEFVDGLIYEMTLRKRIAELQDYRRQGVTSLAEAERYDHARSQRLQQKADNFRAQMMPYDRVASRGARAPGALADRKPSSGGTTPRPSTAALTLANSNSLHLLTPLEQQLCSTLRILPRPYLFLKEVLLREWVRLGGQMGAADARLAVASPRDSGAGATGEWGEKVDRVWEFLVDTGGLRRPEQRKAVVSPKEANGVDGEGAAMQVDSQAVGHQNGDSEKAMDVDTSSAAPLAPLAQSVE